MRGNKVEDKHKCLRLVSVTQWPELKLLRRAALVVVFGGHYSIAFTSCWNHRHKHDEYG